MRPPRTRISRIRILVDGRAHRRLDLNTYHGGYERMPVLAISFLAMGLACTGFPGTLGASYEILQLRQEHVADQ